MKKFILIFSILTYSTIFSFSQINTEYHLQQASLKTTTWFNSINTNNFEAAFNELSFELQSKFEKNDWIFGMNQILKSFGEFNGRKEIYRNFVINPIEIDPILGGFPDGYYAEFQFESNYLNTINHLERIILHQDHKSKWRILDYSYEFTEGENYKEN